MATVQLLGSGSTSPHRLTVSGIDVLQPEPNGTAAALDIEPVQWEDTGGAVGTMSWAVLDTTSARAMQGGSDVRLTVNDTVVFGGTLVRREFERLPGTGRIIRCTAVSYDAWLDWRIVPRWSNQEDLGDRIRKISNERNVVQDLIERRGRPILAPNSTIVNTNSAMDLLRVTRATVREALDIIADEANDDGQGNRRYYVDEQRRLHWYIGLDATVGAAPYRIADGSYIRSVLATSGLVEYWSLREEGGTTSYGSQGVANLTQTGTWTQGITSIGVVNERAYRAVTLDGSADYGSASGASLHPGDTFSLECWIKRSTLGTVQTILSAGTNDYELRWTAGNLLELRKEGVGSNFVSTPAYTDTSWHHVAITRSPGTTTMYVDGASVAGTTTAQTFAAAAGAINVGRLVSGSSQFLSGSIQHVAIYNVALSAATVLAHYQQGVSIAPEDLRLEDDWSDVVHHVYVLGKDATGSGWVYNTGSDFDLGAVQAFYERPRADTTAERDRAGRGYIRRHSKVRAGSFTTREAGAWRAGQAVYITDAALGLSADTFAVAQVRGSLTAEDGIVQDIELGSLRRSLLRYLRRR